MLAKRSIVVLIALVLGVLVPKNLVGLIIPFALGRELYERIQGPKRFVEIDRADHNDLFAPDDERYWREPLAFVAALR